VKLAQAIRADICAQVQGRLGTGYVCIRKEMGGKQVRLKSREFDSPATIQAPRVQMRIDGQVLPEIRTAGDANLRASRREEHIRIEILDVEDRLPLFDEFESSFFQFNLQVRHLRGQDLEQGGRPLFEGSRGIRVWLLFSQARQLGQVELERRRIDPKLPDVHVPPEEGKNPRVQLQGLDRTSTRLRNRYACPKDGYARPWKHQDSQPIKVQGAADRLG